MRAPLFAASLLLASLGAATGCLAPVRPKNPAPHEGPFRSADGALEVRIERFKEYGSGPPARRALLRARRLTGTYLGATLWVVSIDSGSDDEAVEVPDVGGLALAIEPRADGEVAVVTGAGAPQRFRLATGVRLDE